MLKRGKVRTSLETEMVMVVALADPILFLAVQNDRANDVALVTTASAATSVGQVHDASHECIFRLDVACDAAIVGLQLLQIVLNEACVNGELQM